MGFDKKKSREEAIRAGFVQFNEGENVARILPPAMEYFDKAITYVALTYFLHYGVPEGAPPITCPKTVDPKNHWQQRCPICEKLSAMWRELPEDVRKNPHHPLVRFINAKRTKQRYLFSVLMLSTKPGDDGKYAVQKMSAGWNIYKPILDTAQNDSYEDILNVEKGRGFIINLTSANNSKTGYNAYTVVPQPNPSSVTKVLPENWKEMIAANEKYVADIREGIKSYEEIAEMMANSGISHFASGAVRTRVIEPTPVHDELDEEGNVITKESVDEKQMEEVAESVATSKKEEPQNEEDCLGKYDRAAEKCKTCERRQACIVQFVENQE